MNMDTLFLKIAIILYLSENSQGVKDVLKSDRKASREIEYCQFETFSPQCRKDEVIVIDKALYGRMQLSRCIQNDYGYLGCQTNVIDILSKRCSGVRTCSYSVPDLRKLSESCPNDLIVYLSAKHSCLRVINSQRCSKENPTTLTVSELSGYISSYYAYQNGTGSPNCPILIQAFPGQTINITIQNFGDDPFTSGDSNGGRDGCPHHIIVKDGEYVETMNLCHKIGKGGGNSYLSTSHSLRLFFSGLTGLKSRHLIHYKVIGCKPLKPPGDATFELTGEGRGSVKCGQTIWYVTCDGNKWTGQVGNCTKDKIQINGHIINKPKGTKPKSAFSLGLVLAVTIGMVLGLLLGSALLIIVLMRKKKRRRCVQRIQKGNTLLGGDANTFDSEEHYYRHTCQANNCDGRCVAPTTYCGQNRIYNPVTHNYIQDVEMIQQTNSPCQAHAIYAKRTLIESPYNTTPRKIPTPPQTNNKFASILTSKPSNKQSTTTFTTFKPPDGEVECLYDRFGTYQSRRGIIKMPTDSGTVCTCDKADDQTTTTNNVAPKPDVVQTNHPDAENNTNNDGTSTLKKPQVILLPKTNNAKQT